MSYAKYFNGKLRHEGRSSFKTWWFGVVRVTAHEHRRRTWLRWLRFAPLDEAEERAAHGAGPDESAERGEVIAAVQAALARLPERQREIVSLVFIHGLSLDEAAVAAGVSSGSAHTHYQRGKERLRGLLRSHLPFETHP
jgi:RNA polymerase sigma-70 factor (ECF subfamily)